MASTQQEAPLGRRERKRQQTRTTILEVARGFFVEQGYEATSVAQIAEGADIAASTLFGYFPAKADIFFADYDMIVDDFIKTISSRDPAHETAIEATKRWHQQARANASIDTEVVAWWYEMRRLIDVDQTLPSLERQRYEPAELALAQEVAADLGESPDDLRPRMIAAMKVALFFTLGRFRSERGTDDSGVTDEYVDECLQVAYDAIVRVERPRAAGG